MTGPCPYRCDNKTEFGYCLTTGCINPNYQYRIFRNDYQKAYYELPEACKHCPSNPVNGGSGICHCILGS